MKMLQKVLPAIVALMLPLTLVVCTTGSPTNPLPGGSPGGATGQQTNLPSLTTTANRFDVNADGADSVTITATARDAAGNPLSGAQILWTLSTRNFSGSAGSLSQNLTVTGSGGQASVGYRAPSSDFVPVGAIVIVTGTLSIPNNPQASPRSSVSILIRPKGSAPTGGTTGPTGSPVSPAISSVTPASIRVDAVPAVTVLVQGTNFSESSTVLIVTSTGLVEVPANVLSSTQLRFSPPAGLPAGAATLFVSAPGNLLSAGFGVTFTTSSGGGEEPTGAPMISQLLPPQGPVGDSDIKVIILGSNFNLNRGSCSTSGSTNVITFVSEIYGIERVCPDVDPTKQRIEVTAPRGDASGTASVFVTNIDGAISNTATFTYTASAVNPPMIESLIPSSGPTTGANEVLVLGSNFTASDQIVIASTTIDSPPGDTCSDGQPTCSDRQCVLSEARGTCTINGQAGIDVFRFVGAGQIQIRMPNVGTSAAGPADLIVRKASGDVFSNSVEYTFVSPSTIGPPTISQLVPSGYSATAVGGFTFAGWSVVILGTNFRQCSSVTVQANDNTFEFLPTPDVADCASVRGSPAQPSPRDRLRLLLPPDGETIACGNRPDLVPFRQKGACSGNGVAPCYTHDLICDSVISHPESGRPACGSLPCPHAPHLEGQTVGGVTSGGAFTWISESEIRLHFGPDVSTACPGNSPTPIFISNDPGRGREGDQFSNVVVMTFTCTEP